MGRSLTFDSAPRRVYWEMTRACSLACQHCRAAALQHALPGELDTQESRRMLDDLARAEPRPPALVMTGGDPLERSDFWELLQYGRDLGMGVAVAPTASPSLTPEVIGRFARERVQAMSLSLDAADADLHDGIRGVPGIYDRTMESARAVAEVGLPLQVNTLVCAANVDQMPRIAGLVADIGAKRWSLFFLVRTGRGSVLEDADPEKVERLLRWLAELDDVAPFRVATTEAPHYRRIQLERHPHRSVPAAGIRDGNGIMFVSYRGDVYPSGFLPLSAGNVRLQPPLEIYREAPLFLSLRQTSRLHGRCGRCEHGEICGGSRARAYAASGDPFADDPLCAHDTRTTATGAFN